MARQTPRHLKQQPGLMASIAPAVAGRRGTVIATGAALTVPASFGAVAMAAPATAAPQAPSVAPQAASAPAVAAPKAMTLNASIVVVRYGSTGAAVKTVQGKLKIAVDGNFGPQTRSAVKGFQQARGMQQDGIVGPLTWKALGGMTSAPAPKPETCDVNVIRYGSNGSLVKAAQGRLRIAADGNFGPGTLSAVKAFQGSKGLTKDGIVGPATWKALGGFPCDAGGATGGPGGDTTTPPPAQSPGSSYRLPWAGGNAHRITQGTSGRFSHNDRYSRYAMDFAMPTGTRVLASRGGTVYKASWDSYGGGNSVMVRDASGYCMQYNHLSSIGVRVGQSVGQGQQVGRSGSTGNSTGPHLHWGIVSCSGYVSIQVPRTVERGTSYPSGVSVVSANY